MRELHMFTKSIIFAVVVIVLSTLYSINSNSKYSPNPKVMSASLETSAVKSIANSLSIFSKSVPKTPVFFFSHGGPDFMYPSNQFPSDPKAYNTVKSLGKKIITDIKPNFVLVVSAHWESHYENTIEIAVPKPLPPKGALDPLENELIYDFYGFPQHMYEEKFHTKNNLELAKHVKDLLIENGLNSKLTTRGIDHGVWVPFKVAFSTNKKPEDEWDLNVPLIQISLNGANDFKLHERLGQVLSQYRSLGGLVICSGMSVHNLRDLGYSFQTGKTLPYVSKFNELLTSIVKTEKEERFEKLEGLKVNHRQLLYSAHPSLEHFLPIVVASGLAWDEPAKEVHNSNKGSLGWGIYQFGEISKQVK